MFAYFILNKCLFFILEPDPLSLNATFLFASFPRFRTQIPAKLAGSLTCVVLLATCVTIFLLIPSHTAGCTRGSTQQIYVEPRCRSSLETGSRRSPATEAGQRLQHTIQWRSKKIFKAMNGLISISSTCPFLYSTAQWLISFIL